jgi:hypothetical protein
MAGNLTAMIASIFSGGVTADPYYEYTTLLLPGNGTNGAQNNTFLDGSTNNFTITRNGNTTQGTFSPFSQTGWGNYFDGTGDYLSVPDSALFTMGSGNFTIECWVFRATAGSRTFIFGQSNGASDAATSVVAEVTSANKLRSSVSIGNTPYEALSTNNFPQNQWVHVAVVREGGSLNQYINGSLDGQNTSLSTSSINDSSEIFGVGSLGSYSGLWWNGYISNFRVTKGGALYTSAFTPSTTPLTTTVSAGTVSLLTCQSNRFIDNSTNNFTITRNGDTRVVAFSPFNPNSSWSAATYGGSGYFDGSGDYLNTSYNSAFDFGTGDFTLETWFYLTAAQSTMVFVASYDGAGTVTTGYTMQLGSTFVRFVYRAGSSTDNIIDRTVSFNQSSWNHLAFVRSSGVLTFYANGTQIGATASLTASINAVSTAQYTIGQVVSSGYVTGYLSNTRVVKGTAVYTSNFTPPTAPLTAISGTSLLLKYTNAGVIDATSKNDLETVGNAQISTTQSKWGGSSISFDGTGDWLLIPDQPPQRIGTGKFTIELWVYRNSSGTYGLVGKGTSTTGWLVSLNSSNQVVFTYASSTITSTGTVSATTWTHIAVVREGTSTNQTKIYINGTNDGTGTVSTDFNQTNSMYVGADRTGGSAANAYVQDVRITNDARYTANFTAPTAAFPTL